MEKNVQHCKFSRVKVYTAIRNIWFSFNTFLIIRNILCSLQNYISFLRVIGQIIRSGIKLLKLILVILCNRIVWIWFLWLNSIRKVWFFFFLLKNTLYLHFEIIMQGFFFFFLYSSYLKASPDSGLFDCLCGVNEWIALV